MKKLIIILLFALVANVSNAQYKNLPITYDSIVGAETVYFTPSYSYLFSGSEEYSGIVGFQFNINNIKDSLASLILQGSIDGLGYIAVTSQLLTGTNGTYILIDTTPEFVKYRMAGTCISGDTVVLDSITYIQKP